MIKAKKSLGQHFIHDKNLLQKIIKSARLENLPIVEIGGGEGIFTELLLKLDNPTHCFEIDEECINHLKTKFGNNKIFIIVPKSFLSAHESFWNQFPQGCQVIGNIPYNITTPIIEHLVTYKKNIKNVTLLLQKEYGERILAKIGEKAYSSITLFIQYHFDIIRGFVVRAQNFVPRPKVDSIILHLLPKESILSTEEEKILFNLIHAGFWGRRKRLKKALRDNPHFPLDKEKIDQIWEKFNFPEDVRAERLSLEDYVGIARYLVTDTETQ